MTIVSTSKYWIWLNQWLISPLMLKRQSKGENISDHLIATENWDEWKLCGIIPIHFTPPFDAGVHEWLWISRAIWGRSYRKRTMPDILVVFFSKALPTHRFHPQFSRLQDAVCEKLAVSQSQCVICFRQPWSPGFGMHSRGGDGCCFWDDDYVLVLFCLDTVSYFGSIPKKTPLRRNTILTER